MSLLKDQKEFWLSGGSIYEQGFIQSDKAKFQISRLFIDNLYNYAKSLISLINNFLNSIICAIIACCYLNECEFQLKYVLSYSLFLAFVYNKISSFVNRGLVPKLETIEAKRDNTSRSISFTETHAEAIGSRLGVETTSTRIGANIYEFDEVSNSTIPYHVFESTFNQIRKHLNFIIIIVLADSKFAKMGSYYTSLMAKNFQYIIALLTWNSNNRKILKTLDVIADKLERFIVEVQAYRQEICRVNFKNSSSSIISVSGLTIFCPQNKIIQKDITFSVRPGQRLRLVGGCGTGKTTLLKTISKHWPYAEGSITYNRTKKILFLPNTPLILADDSPLIDSIRFPNLNIPTKTEISEIKFLLKEFNFPQECIDHLTHKKWKSTESPDHENYKRANWSHNFSAGQKKLISLISALVVKPDILLLDEPFISLDVDALRTAHNLLIERFKDSIIIFVDHLNSFFNSSLSKIDDIYVLSDRNPRKVEGKRATNSFAKGHRFPN